MIGVNVDITETRRAEQALKESEERFRLIANSAPVPMWVSRLDGKRAFVNQAYMDFLGLGYEDCLVFDWRKALHPDDLQRILREQIAGEGSKQAVRPGGALSPRRRPVALAAVGIAAALGADGEHVGFIGVAHDITAAKQAEIELRGLNETLEAQVEARTRERDRIWNVSQDMLVVADHQGVWLNVNPAATACWAGARPSCSAARRNGSSIPTTSPARAPRRRTWRAAASRSASRTACATRTAPIAGCPGRRRRTRA